MSPHRHNNNNNNNNNNKIANPMRSNRRQRHVARDVMIFGFSFAIIVFFQTVSSYHHQTGIEQSMRQMKEDLLNFPSSSLSSSSSWSFVDVVTNRLEDRMKADE